MKQIVSVGIDVSKGKSTVCAMIHPNTIIKESFEVLHTVEEMSMLADYIGSLDGEIRIVMESTGHYHLPVAQFLYQKGFFVCVENAYIIRQFSRIMLHGAKTDPLDAKKLAKYGLAYWSELKPYKFHPSCYTELSLLSKQYQTYIKLLIAAKQNVIHLMDEMLPGFKEALDTASSVQFSKVKYVDFAKEFYHVDMIKSMGKEIFRENYKQWCKEKGYRFQSEKADELFHLAEDGIPTLPTEFPSTRLCMEVATEQVSQLGYALEQILSQMQNLAKTLPEYQTIRQMGVIVVTEKGNHKFCFHEVNGKKNLTALFPFHRIQLSDCKIRIFQKISLKVLVSASDAAGLVDFQVTLYSACTVAYFSGEIDIHG